MPSHNKVTSKYRPESQSCKRVTEKSQECHKSDKALWDKILTHSHPSKKIFT